MLPSRRDAETSEYQQQQQKTGTRGHGPTGSRAYGFCFHNTRWMLMLQQQQQHQHQQTGTLVHGPTGSWTDCFKNLLVRGSTGLWIYWFSFHSTRWMLLSGMLVANNRPESLAPSRPSSHDVTPARKLDPRLDFL